MSPFDICLDVGTPIIIQLHSGYQRHVHDPQTVNGCLINIVTVKGKRSDICIVVNKQNCRPECRKKNDSLSLCQFNQNCNSLSIDVRVYLSLIHI